MAQDYDVSLKLLFRRSNGVAIERLLGAFDAVLERARRLMPLSIDVMARLDTASVTELAAIADRAFGASTLEEAFSTA